MHDERLWFGFAQGMGPQGNSSGHVGTGQQVADSLLEYWDFGMENFLVRGFYQLGDVQDWGELLIPKSAPGSPRSGRRRGRCSRGRGPLSRSAPPSPC